MRYKSILYYFIAIIGILILLNSSIVLLYLGIFDAGVLLAFVLGILFVTYPLYKILKKDSTVKNNIILKVITVFVTIGFIAFLLIEAIIVIYPLSVQKNSYEVNNIIVLGCGIHKNGQPTLTLKYRLDKCLQYVGENKYEYIVVSGGKGSNEPMAEAVAMKGYLVDSRVTKAKIIVEDKSTSTLENFIFTKNILNEKNIYSEDIVVITNNFHMFRSMLLAKRTGFNASPLSCKTPSILLVSTYLREFMAMTKSFIFDNP